MPDPEFMRLLGMARTLLRACLMQSALRHAAIELDRARALVDNADPRIGTLALQRLTEGRWEMVDWFDAAGRRVILMRRVRARPVATRRIGPGEWEVARSAARGETGKQMSYGLGLSRACVSRTVRSLMRKLKVRTHAELVLQIRCLGTTALETAKESASDPRAV